MSNEIKSALAAILANPRTRAIADDYLSCRIADLKRMTARTMADIAADGGKTLAVSAPSGMLGWNVDGEPMGNVSAHWNAFGSVIASRFANVTQTTIHTTESTVTRRTTSGMADRPSSVAPIRPHVAGREIDGDVITWRMRNALSVIAPGIEIVETDKVIRAFNPSVRIWHAIETVIRQGFVFPKDDGSTVRIPFAPVAMRRSIDAAHRLGRPFAVDRIDDVISDATMRAYGKLTSIASLALPEEIVTDDGTAHAPMGEIAGYLVTRDVRCLKCEYCAANASSRYVIGDCEAPTSIVEFTDAQRVLSRELFAAASASVSGERYNRITSTDDASLLDSAHLDDASPDCGHGADCTADACHGQNVLRSVRIACEALGLPIVASNGGASVEVMDLVALALGNVPTKDGRKAALIKIRALLKQ